MSRRWGISIPWSSLPNEICFINSGMYHPRAGENRLAPDDARFRATGARQKELRLWYGGDGSLARRGESEREAWRVEGRAPGTCRDARRSTLNARRSLHLDAGALLFQLGPHCSRLVLGDPRLHDGRCAIDEILRFLQTEAGELAHHLDDLDLLRAGFLERDRELGLIFGRRGSRRAGTTAGRSRAAHRGGRDRDVELRLEGLDQLGELEDRHVADRIENLVLAHGRVSHLSLSPRITQAFLGRVVIGSGEPSADGGRLVIDPLNTGVRLGPQAPSRCVRSASSAPANM